MLMQADSTAEGTYVRALHALIDEARLDDKAAPIVYGCDDAAASGGAAKGDAPLVALLEGAKLAQLWESGVLKNAFDINRNEPTHWVLDQAPYYLDHAERLSAEDYTPHEVDICRTRVLTVGVNSVCECRRGRRARTRTECSLT